MVLEIHMRTADSVVVIMKTSSHPSTFCRVQGSTSNLTDSVPNDQFPTVPSLPLSRSRLYFNFPSISTASTPLGTLKSPTLSDSNVFNFEIINHPFLSSYTNVLNNRFTAKFFLDKVFQLFFGSLEMEA